MFSAGAGTPSAIRLFAGMLVFRVRAEPIDGTSPPAEAFVVAKNPDEAILPLRKDINFSGYALPPAEMTACILAPEEVHAARGADAAHEKGVYSFHLIGAETPTLPSN